MSLRAKLKSKEAIEEENAKLKEEVQELRARASEHERKKVKAKEEMQELQQLLNQLQRDNKGLKEELSEISKGTKKKSAVPAK